MDELHRLHAARVKMHDEHREAEREFSPEEMKQRAERLARLDAEVSDQMIVDAVPCPRCGAKPKGVLHHEGHRSRFELGCPPCSKIRKVVVDGKEMPAAFRVRADTLDAAVERWNGGPIVWSQSPNPHNRPKQPQTDDSVPLKPVSI